MCTNNSYSSSSSSSRPAVVCPITDQWSGGINTAAWMHVYSFSGGGGVLGIKWTTADWCPFSLRTTEDYRGRLPSTSPPPYLDLRTSLPIGLQKCWGRRTPLLNLMDVKNKTSLFSSFSHASIYFLSFLLDRGGGLEHPKHPPLVRPYPFIEKLPPPHV